MKVLLTKEVDRLGVPGDAVVVKDGYARNYLIPHGLAMLDSPGNRNTMAHVYRRTWKIRNEKQKKEAQKAVSAWGQIEIEIPMRIGQDGKMFGAVTSSDIAQALLAQKNIEVDRRKLQLDEPIKSIGEHAVPLKLHAEVSATIHVHVKAIIENPEPENIEEVPETIEDEIPEQFSE
jgi:large subunit ribosomal protein L9